MKLTINLATRRYVNMRRLNAGLILGFLVLATLLVFKVREVARNQAELGRLRNLSASAGNPTGVKVSEEQLKALSARAGFANKLIQQKSMNWLSLLDRLEEVVPEGVALSDIAPDQREPQAPLTRMVSPGRARSMARC